MELQVMFASIPVSELARSQAWYERLFGRPCDIEVNSVEVMWCIREGAWLYLIEDPDKAGNGVVTIAVDDLESALAELRVRDLTPGEIKPEGEGGAVKSKLVDPDDNLIALIEVPASAG